MREGYTLGLSTYGQNPAACLMRGNSIIAFAEEERFTRIKSSNGVFPGRSTLSCLNTAGISLNDVDTVSIGWDFPKYALSMPVFLVKSWMKHLGAADSSGAGTAIMEMLRNNPDVIRNRLHRDFYSISGIVPSVIEYFPHHLAHAASTFFASGFSDALILVIDGSGEDVCTSVYYGQGKKITLLRRIEIPNSLGWYYAAFSHFLGFRPYEEDGFLMGLAPYGKPNQKIRNKMRQVINVDHPQYRINSSYTLLGRHDYSNHFSNSLVDLFGPPRLADDTITDYHRDVAWAVQHHLERAVLNLVHHFFPKVPSKNLCLAGGVALNCKMNGEILKSGLISNIFVLPASNDAGSAYGAATLSLLRAGVNPHQRIKHAYWGPSYSPSAIENTLKQSKARYRKSNTIIKHAVRALANGKIIAWFQGRMEVGPRALGNRSILANPGIASIKTTVNRNIKNRDEWRPFCPAVLAEFAADLYQGGNESKFMNVAYPVSDQYRKCIPSVIHVDGTTRPQYVDQKSNPMFYELLTEFKRVSGLPAVLNTSLNVKGEPIACTPADALRCFYSTGIDCMAIGDFWLEKPTD